MLERRKQILLGLIGLLLFTIRYELALPPRHIESDKYIGQKVVFNGKIISEPDKRDDFTHYVVGVGQFDTKILVTANRFPELNYGDLIEINGKIDFPQKFNSDFGRTFDYPNYLAKDGIRYVSFKPDIKLIDKDKGSKLFSTLYSIKDKFVENIEEALPEPHSSLAGGITLGLKQSLGKELLEAFRIAGIIHIVVLSGYNMTIILAGVLYALGRFNKIPRGIILALGAILMLGFAAIVGFSATVARATLMAMLAILARFLGRPVLAMRILLITGMAMLFWNPLILFHDPSFQLSFLATFGLIAFSPIVENKLGKHFSFFARITATSSKWRQIFKEIITATIATQIFVLPALVYLTGQFSIVSLPVNLLVLPLISSAMFFTGIVGVLPFTLLGLASTIISKVAAFPAYIILSFIIKISEFSASIPLAAIKITTFPLWFTFLVYFIYLLLLRNFSRQLPNSS